MAPVQTTHDYYAILEITNDASIEVVKKGYRRLALHRHPDRNRGDPKATAIFQLLQEAYETIQDPVKRRDYDLRWPVLRSNTRKTPNENKGSNNAGRTEQPSTSNVDVDAQKRRAERQIRISRLQSNLNSYQNEASKNETDINNLKSELKSIQDLEDAELREKIWRNSWMGYILKSRSWDSPEEKSKRALERLQRNAKRTIKEAHLKSIEKELKETLDKQKVLSEKIAAERLQQHKEDIEESRKRRAEAELRQREAVERAQKEAERVRKETAKRYEEMMAKAASAQREAERQYAQQQEKEEQYWREHWKKQALRREKELEEVRARATAMMEQRLKAEAAAAKAREERVSQAANGQSAAKSQPAATGSPAAKAKLGKKAAKTNPRESGHSARRDGNPSVDRSNANRFGEPHPTATRPPFSTTSNTCSQHERFWPKVSGRHTCSICDQFQPLFVLQCPGCNMQACAACRRELRNKRRSD